MIQQLASVTHNELVARDTFVLSFESEEIAARVQPGQFINVRAWDASDPLLRRPFSVYKTDRGVVSIVFNTVGKGTRILSQLRAGELIDVLGPLGTPFGFHSGDFDTAFLVGGGLGVAPFPILCEALSKMRKPIVTLLGARSKAHLIPQYLERLHTATDDGSDGYEGTVVDLTRRMLERGGWGRPKIFGCGPTPMLRALSALASDLGVRCEISLEGPMGCGFGICQGCPVRLRDSKMEYALMCREGPVFASERVEL